MNEKLAGKFKNREVIPDENGLEYILILKENEDDLIKENKELEAIKKQLIMDNENLFTTLTSLQEEHKKSVNILESFRQKNAENETEIKELKQTIKEQEELQLETIKKSEDADAKHQQQIKELNSQIAVTEHEISIITDKLNGLQARYNDEVAAKNKLEEQTREQTKCIQEKSDEADEMKEKIHQLEMLLNAKEEMIQAEKTEKEEYKGWLLQLKVREEKMKEEKDEIIKKKDIALQAKDERLLQLEETNKKLQAAMKKMQPKPLWK